MSSDRSWLCRVRSARAKPKSWESVLKRVGLSGREKSLSTNSVKTARAAWRWLTAGLLKQPSLILADEPTGALDARMRRTSDILREMVNAGPVPLLLRTAMRWLTSATGVLICLIQGINEENCFYNVPPGYGDVNSVAGRCCFISAVLMRWNDPGKGNSPICRIQPHNAI